MLLLFLVLCGHDGVSPSRSVDIFLYVPVMVLCGRLEAFSRSTFTFRIYLIIQFSFVFAFFSLRAIDTLFNVTIFTLDINDGWIALALYCTCL